jgi:site-specific recombinase XerD
MAKSLEQQSNIEFMLPLLSEFLYELINNNYSSKTVESYRRDLEVMDSFLRSNGLKFKKLTKLDISKYKEYMRSGDYLKTIRQLRIENPGIYSSENSKNSESADTASHKEKSSQNASKRVSMYSGRLGSRSVNRMLSAFRSYLKFLNDNDYPEVPLAADSVKLVKTERKESQVADLDELIKLVEAPETYETEKLVIYRNRALMELLFSTGMRISELISLNREDLKIDKAGQHINDSKIYVFGKGKKQRFVYLTPRCITYLERYLATRDDDYPALFIPYRGLRKGTKDPYIVRLSVNYVQGKIKQYRTLVGIAVPTSAHSLRHGFATYLAENGANPAAIQRLLGHESLQTTSKYVHSSDKFAEEVHKQFHPLKQA